MASKLGKVAICISGLSRTGVAAIPVFTNFFGELNADVFYHTWTSDPVTSNSLRQLYKPRRFLEQPPLPPERTGSFGSMLYSIMIANELKKNYEIEHNFRYDLVIKTRFDLVFPITNKFPMKPISPRTIYCPGGNTGFNHTDYESHGINDILFWGDSESMDIATDLYMYYRHYGLEANTRLLNGHKFDPNDYYYSVGPMIYKYCVKNNIHFVKNVPNIGEVPWRSDVSHLDPIKDYDKIRDRYQQA